MYNKYFIFIFFIYFIFIYNNIIINKNNIIYNIHNNNILLYNKYIKINYYIKYFQMLYIIDLLYIEHLLYIRERVKLFQLSRSSIIIEKNKRYIIVKARAILKSLVEQINCFVLRSWFASLPVLFEPEKAIKRNMLSLLKPHLVQFMKVI